MKADAGYADGVRAQNLNAVHHPALVVLPVDTDDIQAAVRWAAEADLGVGVQATSPASGAAQPDRAQADLAKDGF